MAKTMRLDVVSAEELIFEGTIQELIAPGALGDLGIMPGHAQLISNLNCGELRYMTEEGNSVSLFVSGGIIEVQPTIVTVLADTAIRSEDLDEKSSEEAKQKAIEALEGKDPQHMDYDSLKADLDAAKAQIEMVKRVNKTIRG